MRIWMSRWLILDSQPRFLMTERSRYFVALQVTWHQRSSRRKSMLVHQQISGQVECSSTHCCVEHFHTKVQLMKNYMPKYARVDHTFLSTCHEVPKSSSNQYSHMILISDHLPLICSKISGYHHVWIWVQIWIRVWAGRVMTFSHFEKDVTHLILKDMRSNKWPNY